MLVLNSASSSGVTYWQRSAVHSAWLGQGARSLDLAGAVDPDGLRAVLMGRAPGGGALTARPGQRQRQGWDLVFAAPKSLSLLVADGPETGAATLRHAYRQAVTDAVSTLGDRAAWVRRGGDLVPAQVVAGAFEHLDNDSGHPHLHSHVVLANLGRAGDGKWSCLVGAELWRWREGLGAGFQLALRERLAQAGFRFDWALSSGGLGEIAAVPAAAVTAASARSRAVEASARSFGSGSVASVRVAQGRSRRAGLADRSMTGASGADRPGPSSASSGWGRSQAAAVLGAARGSAALPPPPPAPAAVAEALARRSSAFNEPDVLVALAESCPAGLRLAAAADWARSWCEGGVPGVAGVHMSAGGANTARARWTSARATQLDNRVVDLAVEARFARTAKVSPAVAELELSALGTGGRLARAAFQLTCSGEGVAVLPAAPWLDQAACADAARAIWQAAGMSVQVACPSDLSARRWRALTSLEEPGTVASLATPGTNRSGQRVLVVDAADHLSPVALARLVEQATSRQTKLVLVVGGTVPGSGPSMAGSLDQLAAQLPGSPVADLAGAANLAGAATGAISLTGIAVRGSLTGAAAMAQLVAARQEMAPSGRPAPLMVAFGPAEAEALNAAVRASRAQAGPDGARRQQVLGPRAYAVGDEVLALRRIGPIPSATRGTVAAVGAGAVEVEWRGQAGSRTSAVGADHASSLGYGYATTVPYLRSCDPGRDGLLVLGDPLALAGRTALVVAGWVTVAGPGLPAAGATGLQLRRRAGIAQLATGWPDDEMLERAGPRPLDAGARRRWAEIVTAAAVERDVALPARARPHQSRHAGAGRSTPALGDGAVAGAKAGPPRRRPGPSLGM